MMLQSFSGVLRVFPVWPKDHDASFANLRAYGAFLVSSEMSKSQVKYLFVQSEKGHDLTIQNPWPGKGLQVYRNGHEAEHAGGDLIKLKTSLGERIELRPM
jgi:hypothetical protein